MAGGYSDGCRDSDSEYCDEYGRTTSTEIHNVGESHWRQVEPLQNSLQKPVAVTLDNYIFLTGFLYNIYLSFRILTSHNSLLGGRGSGNMKEIQMFKDDKWVSFGEMKDPRYYHDVSVIELDSSIILDYCS